MLGITQGKEQKAASTRDGHAVAIDYAYPDKRFRAQKKGPERRGLSELVEVSARMASAQW